MTIDEMRAVVDRITYKPSWSLAVRRRHGGDLFLQVVYDGTGEYGVHGWTGRKWLLSAHMTETELVHSAFKAILAAEEHEVRELFRFDGVAVCGPHYSVSSLVALVEGGLLAEEVRVDAMEGA